ncbi:MAG: hypothetical protein UHM85_11250 [Acutalibacteraceae bacterium]|nr:hypothetical protein [Acutalibacteraceae bacterium]
MDALQKVFDTILKVLEIIKNFFADLFPQKDDAAEDETTVA